MCGYFDEEGDDFFPFNDHSKPIPSNLPVELGKAVDVSMFVDSDHAGDKSYHCSYQVIFKMAVHD